jgi:hypothetical protein
MAPMPRLCFETEIAPIEAQLIAAETPPSVKQKSAIPQFIRYGSRRRARSAA